MHRNRIDIVLQPAIHKYKSTGMGFIFSKGVKHVSYVFHNIDTLQVFRSQSSYLA